MRTRVLAGALGLLLSALAPAALAGDDARIWLERMSAAMSQMSYQGTFVYVMDDDVATMRITHVADNGESRERLFTMTGAPREVVRDAQGVRWSSGEHREVLADPAVDRPIFFELSPNDAAQAADSYEFKLQGKDRVAGYIARRLDIVPRDTYRYGYTLWLETQSGLLLQWRLQDEEGDTLARLVFTELKIGSEVDRGELHSSSDDADPASFESGLPAESRVAARPPSWAPDRLPPGFVLASHSVPDGATDDPFEHLVYSDGIAAVSVYVEDLEGKSGRAAGVRQMGTTHAWFGVVDDRFVTVVGDVPEATVRLIGEAVGPVGR